MSTLSNRRGEALTMIVGFVLMALCILLAIMFFMKWKASTADIESSAPCATSIKAHSVAVSLSKKSTDAADLPIVCPTRKVYLKTTDEDKVKETLAKEMKTCWSQWGEGKNKLFTQDGVYCHICTIVNVDGVENVNDFTKYLDTHKATRGQTYFEYLSGTKTGSFFNDTAYPSTAPSYMPVNQTAVIFYHANGKKAIDKMWNNLFGSVPVMASTGIVIGVVAGVVTGLILAPASGGTSLVIVAKSVVVGVAVAGVSGATGVAIAYKTRVESDYMSIVVVKPLNDEDIASLGCKYAPVRNT